MYAYRKNGSFLASLQQQQQQQQQQQNHTVSWPAFEAVTKQYNAANTP
jgi:hypothetical protein